MKKVIAALLVSIMPVIFINIALADNEAQGNVSVQQSIDKQGSAGEKAKQTRKDKKKRPKKPKSKKAEKKDEKKHDEKHIITDEDMYRP